MVVGGKSTILALVAPGGRVDGLFHVDGEPSFFVNFPFEPVNHCLSFFEAATREFPVPVGCPFEDQ